MILPGRWSQALAVRLARETDDVLCKVEHERFPDGESLVRAPDVEGDVVVVASTPTPEAYVELHQLLDVCRDADSVELVMPYVGYGRQDTEFEDGDAVSARALLRSLPEVDRFVTVDVHEPDVLDWVKSDSVDVTAAEALAEACPHDDALVLAPDESARPLAEDVASVLREADVDHLVKTRLSGDEVEVEPKEIPAADRDVLVVDDLVSTGGTMAEAVDLLLEQGASTVHVAAVHGVFAGYALDRLYAAGVDSVVVTDTLETAVSDVSVAEAVAGVLG